MQQDIILDGGPGYRVFFSSQRLRVSFYYNYVRLRNLNICWSIWKKGIASGQPHNREEGISDCAIQLDTTLNCQIEIKDKGI